MTENEISKEVVDACFVIHTKYGPGLFESVYEELLSYELIKRNLKIARQVGVNLVHDDIVLKKAFRADLIVENKLIVEIKSVEELKDMHYKQLFTYMKLANVKLGLLVNFNVALIKNGIHRIVNKL
ncbi:GxxExxY protein [Chitinophaga oryzae]|uniref:GxxExxY protein n=1 Tax=Chitinophaga oryzae TaxID=2725414 RepID=A0AAE6ZL63_9BACT|nr:GxxExxY protein [Chitinophaga oryzae]QJB35259.1 GxxExxY protein [Chitinophaga oryzae]QJB41794.1 GxxExxY protein [Chitinophaga oryzae]